MKQQNPKSRNFTPENDNGKLNESVHEIHSVTQEVLTEMIMISNVFSGT
jgi:hypothetical protein